MRKTIYRQLLTLIFLMVGALVFSQSGQPVYVLSTPNQISIVLGETPREAAGFQVFRQDPGSRDWQLLTPEPIRPVTDPFRAVELMGPDAGWLARRIGTLDPPLIWRKLRADRNTTLAFCLISPGLRAAMGRSFIDDTVLSGQSYRYRVVLLNMYDRVIDSVEKRITAAATTAPEPPKDISASAGDGEVTVSWAYRPYSGREKDLAVGFRVFRQEQGSAEPVNLTPAPILRIEGWLSYIDSNALNGVTYIYSVEAVDLIGTPSDRLNSAAVTPRDTKPPTMPRGLAALDGEDGALLLWKLSPDLDIAGYNVLRSEQVRENYSTLNSQPIPQDQPRYRDEAINRGTTYYYRVVAIDRAGNQSEPSGPVSLVTFDLVPPPEVSGLSYNVDEQSRTVILSWNPVEAPDLLGYNVFRGKTPDNQMLLNREPLESSNLEYQDSGYKKKGLAPGSVLWYAVSAVDQSNNQSPLSLVEVSVPDHVPPRPPLSLSARSTPEGSVLLRWQKSLDKDIALQRIYRQHSSGFQQVAEIDGLNRWTDEQVLRGEKYIYRVTLVDRSGNESDPSPEAAVVPTDIHPPDPPADVEAVVVKKKTVLNWNASPSEDVAGYLVYRSDYQGAPWKRLTSKIVIDKTYTHRGQGVYGVSAVDSSGNESDITSVPAAAPEDTS